MRVHNEMAASRMAKRLVDGPQLAKPGYISVSERAKRGEAATSEEPYEPPQKRMSGDDEMVADRMAKSPVDEMVAVRMAKSPVDKSQLAKPGSFSVSEAAERHGTATSRYWFEGCLHLPHWCLSYTKKELEEEEAVVDSKLAKPGYTSDSEGAKTLEAATSKDAYEPPQKKMSGDDEMVASCMAKSSVDKSQLAKPL